MKEGMIGDQAYVLHLGDCLETLADLEPESLDAIVTDPPFGIGFQYNSHKDDPEGYGEWLWERIALVESKLKPGSPVFVWQAMLNVRRFTEWFPRDWRIFCAAKNWVQMRPVAMQYAFDSVLVWWTEGERWSAGTASRDFHIAEARPNMRKQIGDHVEGHPCPRPLNQVRHIVEQWVRSGGVVADLFAGSGTTGVACAQTGRGFVGSEIDQQYYDVACARLFDKYCQARMWE